MSRDNEPANVDWDVDAGEPGDEGPESNGPAASEEPGPTAANAPRQPADASPTSQEPGADSAATPNESEEGRPCIIIGAQQSGKTSLLLAIHRACDLPDGDDLELAFVAEDATHELIQQVTKIVTELTGGPEATLAYHKEKDYPFRIEARTTKHVFLETPVRASIHMVVKDVPGEALLPADSEEMEKKSDLVARRKAVVEFAKTAGALVFCVDATQPATQILESQLRKLLFEMSSRDDVSEIEPHRSLMSRLRREPAPMWYREKRCLSVDRFLLLLTKVDQLCEGLETPVKYAGWIDPVEQARGLLGPALLNSIRSHLKPSASFAIGVSSAWGFNPVSGQPFAGPQGRSDKGKHITPEEVLLRWTPFGIRDAMFYIASGRCRGTVSEVTAEDLLVRSDLEECEISVGDLN